MGGFSIVHLLVLAVVAVLLLGGGRFSAMMGDVAKGVKNFKKGMTEGEEDGHVAPRPAPRLQAQEPLSPTQERDLQPMRDDRPQG